MKVIVDLFNQHSGDMKELKRLAMNAYCAGADIAKIQILNSKRIWGDEILLALILIFVTYRPKIHMRS